MPDQFFGHRRMKRIEVFDSPFSDRCREARAMAEMTQADVAKATGMNRTTVANIERGSQLPSMRGFVKLCEAYDVSADWLLWGDG